MEKKYDLVILGSGPAGITAGIYAMRARLDTLLLEKGYVTGGQMLNTFEVDNYPGMPQVTGSEMSAAFERHVRQLGLPIRQGEATKIIPDGKGFCIETEEDTYHASAVIIATGTRHRLLNVPGEKELSGMGVSYCATCDGAFYKGKTVAVVGGGDAAVEDGIFLARICKKVYLIHRRDELRAAKILQERLLGLENVEVLWNHEVKEIAGDEHVTDVEVYDNQKNSRSRLAVDGIFIAVGVQPNSQALEQIAATDRAGYFIAGEDCKTSTPGIFAVGDIRTKTLRQIVTAAADGANAVTSVLEYVEIL
ncbi:MAG: thioredoxin-disulfide reductase [Lachnospiraceae bacterium]|nr:thioredoxin-disulfide reductase [Lachnospiraceae bacterium]